MDWWYKELAYIRMQGDYIQRVKAEYSNTKRERG